MAKLTEKCKDLLGNIAIAIEEDLTQVFTVRRAEEHNNWHTAKYPVVFGYVASARSAVKHGLLEQIDRNAFRLTEQGRAAIAPPAAAPTVNAEPWTPSVGDRVRIVRDGENNGVVGYVAKIDSTMPVELYRVYGHWYYQSELEPAASADAVNAADVGGAGVWTSEVGDYVSASCPNINSVFEGVICAAQKYDDTRYVCIEEADGFKRWLSVDKSSFTKLAYGETVSRDPRDAQIAALTRDLEVAVAERDALREALRPLAEAYHEANEHNAQRRPIDPSRGYFIEYKHLQRAALLTQPDPAAAMVAALRSRDNGNRVSVDDVESALEAQWAEGDRFKLGDRIMYMGDIGTVIHIYESGDVEIILEKDDVPNAFDPSFGVNPDNLEPAEEAQS